MLEFLKRVFRRKMECKNCGKRYYTWHESCSVCCKSNTIDVRGKMTYRETIDAFQEGLALGYSPKEALRDLEDCEEVNQEALEELRSTVKYGV